MELPIPSQIVIHDYRADNKSSTEPESLKILQWNVERNYGLNLH